MDTIIGSFQLSDPEEWDRAMLRRIHEAQAWPGWYGVRIHAPHDDGSQRLVIGCWETVADYERWTSGDDYRRSLEEMTAFQVCPPETRWHRFLFGLEPGQPASE